jgi:hypothetical protein
MKKIGIITYHAVCNFGAQLQTISTVGFLKRSGYDPVVLHWYPKDLDEMYQERIPIEQYKIHKEFAEQNMPLTKLCRTESDLIQVIEENNIDAIILGSDALFKYLPLSERRILNKRKLRYFYNKVTSDRDLIENPFWGYFIPRLKKQIPVVAFSVSSQNSPFHSVNQIEYKELKRLLSQFKYITVRDGWTQKMVHYFLGKVDVPITPDPVFSFNQNTYLKTPTKEELLKKYNIPDNYVLLSFRLDYLNEDYIKHLEIELNANNYTAVVFPMPEGGKAYGLSHKIDIPLSPLNWYYLIKYADGYIGERMHPIIVALHNAVPFFCFDEYGVEKTIIPYFWKKYISESSKIYHILSKFDLLDNTISYKKNIKEITPQRVVEELLKFNKKKVDDASGRYQKYYENSMLTLLEYIK